MNRTLRLSLLLVLALAITACAGKKEQVVVDETPADTGNPIEDNNVFGTGLSAQQLADLGIIGDPLNYNTVLFEYNSSAIDRRSEVIARAHARELARRGGASVVLEGHADERGTRDYNLALGERRAQAVQTLMRAEGDGGSDLKTVSFGEERPLDDAHTEAAWKQNRRVVISY